MYNKRFEIIFAAGAIKEYKKLDDSIIGIVNKAIDDLEFRADEVGKSLKGKLYGCKEKKLKNECIRIIFRKDRIKKEYNKYADRLLNYIQDRKDIDEFEKEGKFRFYILSETEQIRLDKNPVPIHGHGPGKIYYTLSEILSGKKKIRSENECKDNNI
jgi:mRNA-degrading endonuclease RelE of RelBE toxin-antitoxin system